MFRHPSIISAEKTNLFIHLLCYVAFLDRSKNIDETKYIRKYRKENCHNWHIKDNEKNKKSDIPVFYNVDVGVRIAHDGVESRGSDKI